MGLVGGALNLYFIYKFIRMFLHFIALNRHPLRPTIGKFSERKSISLRIIIHIWRLALRSAGLRLERVGLFRRLYCLRNLRWVKRQQRRGMLGF